MIEPVKFQIGKFGITPGVIESIELAFKNHNVVRISVLKASGRDKNSIIQMANNLVSMLKIPVSFKIIGFTIVLRKSDKKR